MKKIIIYGAGNYGKKLWAMLCEMGIAIYCFCQTESVQHENTLFGIKILPVTELLEIAGDKLILIAINNVETSKEIKQRLLNELKEDITIFECGDFIRTNLNTVPIDEHKHCITCNTWIKEYMPAGNKESVFQKYHVVGGGYRENAVCPKCYSLDRTRWCFYILKKYTGIFRETCKVLHFAPEDVLAKRICINEKCDYYSCDLVIGKAAHIVDVTNIPFNSGVFDYIIMNHVLEHVQDEKQAVMELNRVLKTEGKLIISFPICMDIDTLEGNEKMTKEDRVRIFGQEDHMRLYGRNYKERLENYGLKVESYSPIYELTLEEIEKYGFIKDDIMLVCTKET
ncbi:MAG: methyltransferase domain-containing protein [Dorea sp.]|jgi:Methylase involved in ubiquinone/menaquinone biosynthesis|nr:methyltransferase domain-containing protein [Dorea sp.]